MEPESPKGFAGFAAIGHGFASPCRISHLLFPVTQHYRWGMFHLHELLSISRFWLLLPNSPKHVELKILKAGSVMPGI